MARGRPPFKPTAKQRERVKLLKADGWSNAPLTAIIWREIRSPRKWCRGPSNAEADWLGCSLATSNFAQKQAVRLRSVTP